MFQTLPLFGGLPGGPELLVILLIAVLLFGANKIPKLARSSGEALGEFQKGREEVEQELQEMREGGQRSEGATETTTTASTPEDTSATETTSTAETTETQSETASTDAETEEETR